MPRDEEGVDVYREDLLLPLVEGKDVLDCGGVDHCYGDQKRGEGVWLHEKIAKVANSCTGVDILQENVARINAKGEFHFIAANAEELGFDSEFDVVVGGEFIEHVYNAGRFLDSAWRALRPGGALILTTPNAYAVSAMLTAMIKGRELCHPEHTCYYSAQTLHYLVSHHGFEVVTLVHVDRPAANRVIGQFRSLFSRLRPAMGEVLFLVARKKVDQDKFGDKW